MIFADIHNHSLAAVDDGAASDEIMYRMIEAAYADGTRLLCLTPHFHPFFFGDNRENTQESFRKLRIYASEHCPQLRLLLGNELRYNVNCDHWMQEGLCRTLDGNSLVLVDFTSNAGQRLITRGVTQLLSMGYQPVLAHAERYADLPINAVQDFIKNGVRIQINAGSLLGSFGWSARLRARRLLSNRLVHMVASDAHDLYRRSPTLSKSYHLTKKITDESYADRVFYYNALDLLDNNREGLVNDDE